MGLFGRSGAWSSLFFLLESRIEMWTGDGKKNVPIPGEAMIGLILCPDGSVQPLIPDKS